MGGHDIKLPLNMVGVHYKNNKNNNNNVRFDDTKSSIFTVTKEIYLYIAAMYSTVTHTSTLNWLETLNIRLDI